MDMWQPFINAVGAMLLQAVIVLDKFHLVRKAEYSQMQVARGHHLKGCKYFWLKLSANVATFSDR